MKLISVSKRCPCGKRHRMNDTEDLHLCRCKRKVTLTAQEKNYYIKHEEELSRAQELAQ